MYTSKRNDSLYIYNIYSIHHCQTLSIYYLIIRMILTGVPWI